MPIGKRPGYIAGQVRVDREEDMIKVSVVGAKGRMGSHVVEAVNNAEDTQLALALDAGDDLTQITTDNTDVVVEFTVRCATR